MAEGDNQNFVNFDGILQELNKISQIEIETKVVKSQVKDVEGEIVEIRQHVGLDEDEKQKNVISDKDLPATLTVNERQRYINIGKNFVLGAGSEFQKIQKAIRFKESMKTSHNEFLDKIDKIKENVKKTKSSSGFWKTLLKVGALLGLIVYLWKTKIQENFPNVASYVEDTFASAKVFVKESIGSVFSYVASSLSGGFESVLKDMVTEYIPALVHTFFTATLPRTLLNTYLAVLAGFSSDAEAHLNTRLEADMAADSERVTEAAQQEVVNTDTNVNIKGGIDAASEAFRSAVATGYSLTNQHDLTMMQRHAAYLSSVRVENGAVFENVSKAVGGLINSQASIVDLASQGKLDMGVFLSRVKQYQEDNNLTNQEVVQAVAEAMGVTAESISKLTDGNEQQAFSAVEGVSSLIRSTEQFQGEFRNRANALRQEEEERRREYEANLEMYKPIHVNFTEVLEDAIFNHVADALKKITDFISSEGGAESKLYKLVKDGVKNFGDFYDKYFSQSVSLVTEAFANIGRLFKIDVSNPSAVQSTDTPVQPQQTYGDNNIIVNIDMGVSGQTSLGALIAQIGTIDNDISSTITATNSQLVNIINTLKDVGNLHTASKMYIDEQDKKLHTIMDAKETIVWTQVNKNKEDIQSINGRLNATSQQASVNVGIPIVMRGNVQ